MVVIWFDNELKTHRKNFYCREFIYNDRSNLGGQRGSMPPYLGGQRGSMPPYFLCIRIVLFLATDLKEGK